MDPLSITAAVLGISHPAISSIVKLRNLIHDTAEAKELVQDICASLEGIQRPLALLAELSGTDSGIEVVVKRDLEHAGVPDAVQRCGEACEKFSKSLEKWTRHSSETRMSFRDRFTVGIRNKERIQTLRTQVQSCQNIVQFAVQTTQL